MAPGLVHDLGLKLMEGRGDTRTLRTCQGTTQYSTNVGGRAQSCARRVVVSDLPALGARTGEARLRNGVAARLERLAVHGGGRHLARDGCQIRGRRVAALCLRCRLPPSV